MDHSALHERFDGPHGERSSARDPGSNLPAADQTADCARQALAASAVIKYISVDHLSDVRYLHAQAIKNLASGEFSDDESAAVKAVVYSQKYVSGLSAAIGRRQFFGAWIGDMLVGTAGWSAMDDSVAVARIRSIFVSPLYMRMGLAQKLLGHVEIQAADTGFRTYSVRSMANATGFFVRQGYVVTSHGVRSILPERNVPVTFLRKTHRN